MEYIDREVLLEFLQTTYNIPLDQWMARNYWSKVVEIKQKFISCIEKIPTADVAPVVHARWIDNHCTACGMMPMGEELWDSCEFAPPKFEYFMGFCPHCGARMDGGKDG